MFLLSAIYIVVVDMPHQASELETLESILINTSAEPAKLTYALIKSIARNFSQEIGHGRFGVVYLV